VVCRGGLNFPLLLIWLLAAPQALASGRAVLLNFPSPELTGNWITPVACADARVDVTPLPAGLMRIAIASPCRPNQSVHVLYAGIELVRALGASGEASFDIDCIAGDDFPVDVMFEDGSRNTLKVAALDLARVTKIAVLWRAPVNLDLHAFEYAARPDSPGHIWAGAPSSSQEAEAKMKETARGHGFMSSISNGTEAGTKLEVYTFLRQAEQKSGVISMALDYESRAHQPQDADTCGNGLYSEVRYETILLDRNTSVKRQFGSLAAVDCNTELSGLARFNNKTVPEITAKP
jgi:hypothetical protein